MKHDTFSTEFSHLKTILAAKLAAANYPVSDLVQEQLLHYLFLLNKWNRTYNLTSVREPEEMITQHILDSLSITPYLQGERILDVGSGGGLPGIPLALTHPHYHFVLLDSNGKKTRFLHHVITSLGIKNVEVVQERVEKFISTTGFNTIVARAFSSIIDFLLKTQHLCCADGVFLAMKGHYPTGELVAVNDHFKVLGVTALHVPGMAAERHVVCIGLNHDGN